MTRTVSHETASTKLTQTKHIALEKKKKHSWASATSDECFMVVFECQNPSRAEPSVDCSRRLSFGRPVHHPWIPQRSFEWHYQTGLGICYFFLVGAYQVFFPLDVSPSLPRIVSRGTLANRSGYLRAPSDMERPSIGYLGQEILAK